MCGIAGLVGPEPASERLGAMLDVIRHRGPDDDGQVWTRAGDLAVGLGSVRLAILDLSPAGHQPMETEEGDLLVYNGEVYNWKELRAELEARGVPLRSGTDTEVVLHLLSLDGPDALRRLNGMFALAYWDASERELLLARDRFGVKPLYVHEGQGGALVFASELKALLAAGVPAEPDVSALPGYLGFGYVPGEATLLRDIRQLPQGTMLRWRDGKTAVEPFRGVEPEPEESLDEEETALELRERLRDAVRRQLIADVPVGILLSGGLDSTSILGLAAYEQEAPVRAYTIAFRDEDARLEQNPEDAAFARTVSAHFGAELREFVVAPDLVELLPRVAWHLDEPLGDPAAILTLIISEAAREECTVLLSGMGADELFAGYRVQQYDRWASRAEALPKFGREVLAWGMDRTPALATHLPRPGLAMAGYRAVSAVLENAGLPREQRYAAFRSAQHFHGSLLRDVLSAEVRATVSAVPDALHVAMLRESRGDFFDRMLHLDIRTFLEDQNLLYSDRLSMAASVEMRVPFLDDAVADLALRIPGRLKVRGVRGKHILRRAMDGVVPHEVTRRRKAGFGAPIRRWLQMDLRDTVRELLAPQVVASRGLLDPAVVTRLIDEHVEGRADHTYRLWTLVGLEMWFRRLVDGA